MAFGKSYYNEDHKLVRYGIGSFFRDLFTFIGRFFSPSNIRHAFREVIRDARGYAAFFMALTVAQSFFWMIGAEAAGYRANAVKAANACSFNLIIEGYTDDEWTEVFNSGLRVAEARTVEERGYVSVETSRYYGTSGDTRVRVTVRLTSDTETACRAFLQKYRLGGVEFDPKFKGEEVSVTYGERTAVLIRLAEREKTTRLVEFLSVFVAAFVIMLIFRIRANQFRFRYGIYMAFGADFSKLLETAGWEMLAVAALTFLPGAVLGVGLAALLGGTVTFAGLAKSVLPGLGWIIAAVLIAVLPSVRMIASSTPVSLIAAQDNSNYVTSPKRSFRIFGRKFPLEYEFFSVLRFRKYYAGVLAAAACFSLLYYTGGFFSGLAEEKRQADLPQFVLTSPDRGFDADVLEAVSEMDNAGAVVWSDSINATLISAHVLMTPEQSDAVYGRTVRSGDMTADNLVRFTYYSDFLASQASEFGLWTIDGDVSQITPDGNSVAVTVSVGGKKSLDISPGDEIKIGIPVAFESGIDFSHLDNREILSALLDRGDFRYLTVKVAAVIENGDTDEKFTVYLPDSLFTLVTGRDPAATDVEVYLDRGAKGADAEKLRTEITNLISHYAGSAIEDTGRVYEKYADSSSPVPELILAASAALLTLSVPVWAFSQATFFRKRRLEFYMLRALGGTRGSVTGLCLTSGWMTALPAGLLPGTAGMLIGAALFDLITVKLPSYGFGDGVRYSFTPGFWIVAAGIAVPAAAAFFSSAAAGLSASREKQPKTKKGSAENGR